MLTAVKAFYFYRQLLNLLRTPGAAQTNIYIFIDGPNQEIIQLAHLFKLPIHVHRSQGERGSATKLNMHFKFSVWTIFNMNFQKAIILEDDLLLSPDFLRFFQQTAWLLDADPTIYAINAFHLNSIGTVACDPSALLRIDGYPQFGWLISRNVAESILPYWVFEKDASSDWDWWLGLEAAQQRRKIILPEVSRTFHAGSAGSHVTGWEQSLYYDNMIYNTEINATLKSIYSVQDEIYDAYIRNELTKAELLSVDFNPCTSEPFGTSKAKSFKLYIHAEEKLDKSKAFTIIARCLHAHSRDSRGTYKRMQKYNVNGRHLYIVGCPSSIFCPTDLVVQIHVPTDDMLDVTLNWDMDWRFRTSKIRHLIRRSARSAEEEFQLLNTLSKKSAFY